MTSERIQREFDGFHAALEHATEERVAFLEATYGGDPELVRRIRRLLDAQERAVHEDDETLPTLGMPFAPALDPEPDRIGPYRVLERIGEGGMGVVYAAEQREPFHRRVAIKVIKPGMESKEVITRFGIERRAMAMMDHPGVAKALDAGVTERGRPYFVMELVKGLPLIEYCARQRLSLRERLELFAEVCSAIRHAHHRGVIHRDLKPSNILVTLLDGRPAPKVIDFGIARAIASPLTERTLITEQGKVMGTPDYMAPEQAGLRGMDVDTRADVYSLGVILYELVTGVLPFDPKALRAEGNAEALRIIREVDPPRPSARLMELAREGRAPAETASRARAVRGEFDWIVMRALEKDPTRRYGTASALAEDIERYLADRPVLAGPPSAAYALLKFVKRHRVATALIALVLFSAAVGIVGLTIGLARARHAEELARRRAVLSQAAAGFLERVLFQGDPEFQGGSVSLLQVMDDAGRLIEEDLAPYPEVEASVREALGVAYRRRSLFERAAPHLRRSLEIRRELFGEFSPETASASIAVADLRFEHEGSIVDALSLLGRATDAYEAHGLTGGGPEAWLQLDIGFVNLAGDRLGDAARAFGRCRDLLARVEGPEDPDMSRPIRGFALVALGRGDPVEAEGLAREAVALCRGAGQAYIRARAEMVLAQVLLSTDQIEEASELLDRIDYQLSNMVGRQHIRIAERYAILAALHLRQGEYGSVEHIAARCEALRRELLDEDHWEILEAQLLVQRARIGLGRLESVGNVLANVDQRAELRLGSDHPLAIDVVRARLELAEAEGDAAGRDALASRLAELQARRATRLRSE
jgi:non-specific serine/threonine protein kinase/serine/threonine-protein kinase